MRLARYRAGDTTDASLAGFDTLLPFAGRLCLRRRLTTSVGKLALGNLCTLDSPEYPAHNPCSRENDIQLEYEVVKCLKQILNNPVRVFFRIQEFQLNSFSLRRMKR